MSLRGGQLYGIYRRRRFLAAPARDPDAKKNSPKEKDPDKKTLGRGRCGLTLSEKKTKSTLQE